MKHGEPRCAVCGEPQTGDACCPYCGAPSASTGPRGLHSWASSLRRFAAATPAGAQRLRVRWKSLVVTTTLAASLFALGELAGTGVDRKVGPVAPPTLGGTAAHGGALIVRVGTVTPAPGLPASSKVEPPPQAPPAPAAAAPNQSLCSAASEAAGLCTPQ